MCVDTLHAHLGLFFACRRRLGRVAARDGNVHHELLARDEYTGRRLGGLEGLLRVGGARILDEGRSL